jgi:hypothetical protein
MKDSIKIFLLLSVFSVLLCSCSNDDDNKSKFLKLVETAADGTSTTTLFKYNGDEIATIDGIGSR